MKEERFFIIWFSGLSEDGTLCNGSIEYSMKNGRFFNEENILNFISNKFKLDMTFVKNFIELKKSDFMDYIKESNRPPEFPEGEVEFL